MSGGILSAIARAIKTHGPMNLKDLHAKLKEEYDIPIGSLKVYLDSLMRVQRINQPSSARTKASSG